MLFYYVGLLILYESKFYSIKWRGERGEKDDLSVTCPLFFGQQQKIWFAPLAVHRHSRVVSTVYLLKKKKKPRVKWRYVYIYIYILGVRILQ